MSTSSSDALKVRNKRSGPAASKQSSLPALRRTVVENVRALVLTFRMCGFNDEGYEKGGTIDWHMKCINVLKGDWMAFYKYKGAAFYAAAEEQADMPTSPFEGTECQTDRPDMVLGGTAARWARRLKKENPKEFQRLAYSVLNAKRGMVRPDKQLLKKAEEKAFVKLTTPQPDVKKRWLVDWGDVEALEKAGVETYLSRETIEAQLRRTVREVLKDETYTVEDRLRPFAPSTSANYTRTRAMGGMVGEILADPQMREGLSGLDAQIVFDTLDDDGVLKLTYDDSELRVRFMELMRRATERALDEDRKAEFLALAESLKTRVITKGPPYTNFVLKPLQRKLWSALRKCKAARLVGETISEEYLCRQLGELRDGEEYVSVDYSDATNEIRSWVSKTIIGAVADVLHLSESERLLFENNLIHHIFQDPRHKGQWAEQEEGQLMGSITSFPVLCFANLALCRWSQELNRRRQLSLERAALVINGDDAVLRGTSSFRFWSIIAPELGLKPSPGKVYRSRTFLNMNSTLFNVVAPWAREQGPQASVSTRIQPSGDVVVDIEVRRSEEKFLFLERVLYVNLGLIEGLKRSETKASVADVGLPDSLGAVARWLVESSPPSAREVALKAFLNRRWKDLSKTSLPWFLPENLGGLGIPRPASKLGQGSLKEDMRFAAALYKHAQVPRRPKNTEWKTWEYITQRLKQAKADFELVIGQLKPEGAEKHLQGLLAVESLLTAKDLSTVYTDLKSKAAMSETRRQHTAYIRQVERVVKKARKFMGSVQPFLPDHLPSAYEPEKQLIFVPPTVSTAAELKSSWATTTPAGLGLYR